MKKAEIINFFDALAPQWDEDIIHDDEIIHTILDHAKVGEGKEILDVACGTGVLIPDYLARNVKSVTAIDISPEMVKIAQRKFAQENVRIICGDAETAVFEHKFDCIVVYNAFPHFREPEKLIQVLTTHLKPGGTLTVAHGMSREKIDRHHAGDADKVSMGLMSEDALAAIMEPKLQVTVKISDDKMYQVTGVYRSKLEREKIMENQHKHVHSEEEKKKIVNRISKAIGHMEAVKKMVLRDEDCSDVLIQLAAVRAEINNTGKAVLKNHVSHCIVDAVEEGDMEAIENLNHAINMFVK